MHTDEYAWTEADRLYVTQCLSREPKGVIGVAARDKQDRPCVIMNQPLIHEGQSWLPFPTLYWLVDPELSSTIADIERKGGVRDIEQALRDDADLLEQHIQDNKRYAAKRWALLNQADRELAEAHGLVEVLRDSGVGGIANHEAIKCLHAQLAYHLSEEETGTAVGRLLATQHALPI